MVQDRYVANKLYDEDKQLTRDYALDFFKQYCPWKDITLFSLPSALYSYEHFMAKSMPDKNLRFLGVERSVNVFMQAIDNMPGNEAKCEWNNNRGKYPIFAQNNKCVLVRTTVNDFLSSWGSAPQINAVWLDLCGMLCAQNIYCIENINNILSASFPVIPMLYTFMAAREHDWFKEYVEKAKCPFNQHMAEPRIVALFNYLGSVKMPRTFVYAGHLAYYSNTNGRSSVPMCLVKGLLCKPECVLGVRDAIESGKVFDG